MLTTKFYFADQEEASRIAGQMAQAAEKAIGFGDENGVRISPIIKPEENVYAASMMVGPDTPEFNMTIHSPMDIDSVPEAEVNGELEQFFIKEEE